MLENAIFSCGQVYVALLRVTFLEGLHLINFDLYSVKASELSVIEYNRLRQLYRPDLVKIEVSARGPKAPDFGVVWHVNGLQNVNGVSYCANATI